MAKSAFFPDIITRLPEADIPFRTFQGWMLQGKKGQILWIETAESSEHPHAHGAEYVYYMEGVVDVFFNGEHHLCKKGDALFIPDQAEHSAVLIKPERAIAYFYDKQRYKPKVPQTWVDNRAGRLLPAFKTTRKKRTSAYFPYIITLFPVVDLPFKGITGWLFQGHEGQMVFYEYESEARETPQSHGNQWLAVMDGELTVYINDKPHKCRRAETLFIPAGATHYCVANGMARSVVYYADVS